MAEQIIQGVEGRAIRDNGPMVLIEHPDGRQYAMLPADFEAAKDTTKAGFKAVSYEDGSKYMPPKPEPVPASTPNPAKAHK
jgi:hypothetical protein